MTSLRPVVLQRHPTRRPATARGAKLYVAFEAVARASARWGVEGGYARIQSTGLVQRDGAF